MFNTPTTTTTTTTTDNNSNSNNNTSKSNHPYIERYFSTYGLALWGA